MATRQLNEAVLDLNVRTVNAFNGRLFSAEDLRSEQDAAREERRRLGRAVGDGIAYGLEVAPTVGVSTTQQPVVSVAPGLAIDQRGQAIQLAEPVDVALVRAPPGAATGAAETAFSACQPDTGVYVAGAGLYLLTISSVEVGQGRALSSGVGQVDVACNTKFNVAGVKFRLLALDLDTADLSEQALLRNRVAYRCFGVEDTSYRELYANLLGAPVTSYGLVDGLRPNRLAPCEVPLAVLYWTSTAGLVFLDMWAVRRRVTAPTAASRWPALTGDRRLAEGEAMFMQFQRQVEEIRANEAGLTAISATQRFDYLPPVGLLPLATGGTPRGFDYTTFFSGLQYRKPIFIEAAQLRPLLEESYRYPPIHTRSKLVVWLYLVRENAQVALTTASPPQAYLVFASGHTPYRGEAHYNVHHWNFSNLA